MEYEGGNDNDIEVGIKTLLEGNGDFRNQECINILKESDIVVTNPPFSLFREYVSQLMEYEKKFIVLSNMNAITYKEFFPLIKNNKVWVGNGFNLSMVFKTPYPNLLEANRKYVISKGYNPDEGYVKTPAIAWFTNLAIQKRHEKLILWKNYTPEEYPKYDNYDAIEVGKVSDIPVDYDGIMGVPITFLDSFNPEQFEIIGISSKDHSDDIPRIHDNAYYNGYTRGKVVTRIESNMPIMATDKCGGTKCSKAGHPNMYQLYWRIFIRRKDGK
jgi:hypothetical protein